MPRPLLLLVALLLCLPAAAEDRKRGHTEIYRQASSAIVGINCHTRRATYFGTGTIVHADGYILTSTTVVPPGASQIEVVTSDGKKHEAKLIGANADKEASLIQLDGKDWPHVDLGSSADVEPGQVAYTIGNVRIGDESTLGSLTQDGMVTMSAGLVSGVYEITEAMEGASYKGIVIETSAAVNPGLDGGPLLDVEGKVIGVLSLSYSKVRWLGVAVPIDGIRPYIQGLAPEAFGAPPARTDDGVGPAYLGVVVADEEDPGTGVPVVEVNAGSPADRVGIAIGDRILEVDGKAVHTAQELETFIRSLKAGAQVRLKVKTGSGTQDMTATLDREPL